MADSGSKEHEGLQVVCDGLKVCRRQRQEIDELKRLLAAVRAVGQLVAQASDPDDLSAAVCGSLLELLGPEQVRLLRVDGQGRPLVAHRAGWVEGRVEVGVWLVDADWLEEALSPSATRPEAAAGPFAAGELMALTVHLAREERIYGLLQLVMAPDQARNPATRFLAEGVAAEVAFAFHELELEQQFLQAQKMEAVGRLAGGVAHDFNNLLTVILNAATFARESLADGDREQLLEDIDQVSVAAKRAAELTTQLLAFGRRQVLQPDSCDVSTVVRELERMLVRLLDSSIELQLQLDEALPQVELDRGQFEQVVMNLVINARDAMPKGGTLRVETLRAEAPRRGVVVVVSDTGCGMDAATQAQIFEPFFTTKEAGKGTGLGLSTVYGIVTQSGGHLEVHSASGEGTAFRIFFPCDARARSRKPAEALPAAHNSHGTEHVLVAEDEAALRVLASRILRRAGYQVSVAASLEQAFELVQGGLRPDLLLSDMVMPEGTGADLARLLAASLPELRVVYMSGYGANEVLSTSCLCQGLFLQKPFSAGQLRQLVRQALDTPCAAVEDAASTQS